jgi:hypothetical protein
MVSALDKVGFRAHWCKGCRLIRIFGEAEGREPPVGGIDLGRRVCRFTVKHVTHAGARRLG